jgi:dimethylhistidine N-methyltransferase
VSSITGLLCRCLAGGEDNNKPAAFPSRNERNPMPGRPVETTSTPGVPGNQTPKNASLVLHTRNFEFIDCKPQLSSFRKDVLEGLAGNPKVLDPKLFYDEEGSRLFELICNAPEYYPTRSEAAVLDTYAEEIKREMGQHPLLIEFGSGSSQKVRLLLDKIRPSGYVAVEISREQLLVACDQLSTLYPHLDIAAVCADYSQPLDMTNIEPGKNEQRVAFFPGSTIGNFKPEAAVQFLVNLRLAVGPGGGLLIGVDLKKSPQILNAAYNDKEGVTAAFNLNLLHRINEELDANFDLSRFRHRAFYNEALGRIEMHLVSSGTQQVRIEDKVFHFDMGESIHTENSYKYTVDEFQALAAKAGFQPGKVWMDQHGLFSVHYLVAT